MTDPRHEPRPLPSDPDRLPVDARASVRAAEPTPPVGWQAPLLDLAAAVLRRWQLFAIVLTLGLGVGVTRYVTTQPFFQSTCVAILMPREKPVIDLETTNGSLRTGRDIAARGNTGAMMLPASVDTYTQLLRSDAVLAAVGQRFASRLHLADDIRAVELVHAIRNVMKVSGTEEGMITVEATAPDPALAADIANALVDEMAEASKESERQLLAPQVEYLRSALARARLDVEGRERSLQQFLRENGVVNLDKQTSDILSLIRDTEYVRQGKVQQRLERLESFTEDDHVARALQRQIEELDADIEKLRARAYGASGAGGLSTQEMQMRIDALRADTQRARDWEGTIESQLTLFTVRLNEPTGAVTVLKRAIPVRLRAGPSKGGTIGASILIAFVLGVIAALLREQWERVGHDPYLSRRAEEIRQHAKLLAPAWLASRLDGTPSPVEPRRPEPVGEER